MKEFKKVLIAGNGDLSVGMGVEFSTDLPFISIRQLLEKVEVGSDTGDKEGIEALTILFTNLESLEVLEGACVRVREVLEKRQEKIQAEKDLAYWKKNADDSYADTPISVLRYISELEKQLEQSAPWYDEDKLTERMDIIGQNGNEGEHYNK
jgi:hypothetical protein